MIITALLLIARFLYKKSKEADYFVKQRLLTQTELEYYEVIRSLISSQYVILPQINLASVIDKKGGSNFRSELFRNIDFGVFDGDLRPIFLIEINDNTHFRRDRKERDKKVNKICKKAGIPLVTFWEKKPRKRTKKKSPSVTMDFQKSVRLLLILLCLFRKTRRRCFFE